MQFIGSAGSQISQVAPTGHGVGVQVGVLVGLGVLLGDGVGVGDGVSVGVGVTVGVSGAEGVMKARLSWPGTCPYTSTVENPKRPTYKQVTTVTAAIGRSALER
jgi:hypothetical protein